MRTLKLGKHPATRDHRDLLFANYATGTLPRVPRNFGHENTYAPTQWGLLGNDQFGDCVFAGAAHETMLWNKAAGHPVQFTDAAVLSDYSAVTGFDVADPSTDQGTNVRDALRYRQKTGIVDAHGNRHRIGAYVALEPGNVQHLYAALYLFGAVGIGIQFPSSAMTQFNQDRPWSVVPGSKVEGGHYIPLVAKRNALLDCVTWGRIQPLTLAFYAAQCDEAWALLSPEFLKAGKSPEGFSLPALKADLAQL